MAPRSNKATAAQNTLPLQSKTCSSCQHWQESTRFLTDAAGTRARIGDVVGQCRANPPVQSFVWPRTRPEDHCGKWEERTS